MRVRDLSDMAYVDCNCATGQVYEIECGDCGTVAQCQPIPVPDPAPTEALRQLFRDHDPVNPPHYRELSPEPIDAIEGWGLGYNLGNAVKYIARAGRKGGPEKRVEDLRKALFYLTREVERG